MVGLQECLLYIETGTPHPGAFLERIRPCFPSKAKGGADPLFGGVDLDDWALVASGSDLILRLSASSAKAIGRATFRLMTEPLGDPVQFGSEVLDAQMPHAALPYMVQPLLLRDAPRLSTAPFQAYVDLDLKSPPGARNDITVVPNEKTSDNPAKVKTTEDKAAALNYLNGFFQPSDVSNIPFVWDVLNRSRVTLLLEAIDAKLFHDTLGQLRKTPKLKSMRTHLIVQDDRKYRLVASAPPATAAVAPEPRVECILFIEASCRLTRQMEIELARESKHCNLVCSDVDLILHVEGTHDEVADRIDSFRKRPLPGFEGTGSATGIPHAVRPYLIGKTLRAKRTEDEAAFEAYVAVELAPDASVAQVWGDLEGLPEISRAYELSNRNRILLVAGTTSRTTFADALLSDVHSVPGVEWTRSYVSLTEKHTSRSDGIKAKMLLHLKGTERGASRETLLQLHTDRTVARSTLNRLLGDHEVNLVKGPDGEDWIELPSQSSPKSSRSP